MIHRRTIFSVTVGWLASCGVMGGEELERPIRVGMIGLDTSHVIAFTRHMNNPNATDARANVSIVAGFPSGSPDMPRSARRVDRFTQQLRDEMNVEIVDSIGELLEKVDAVLLTSVDGRPHLQQITPVLEARKPVFVGKPVAGCLADVIRIYRLAERHRVPIFAASSRRFNARILETADPNRVGEVVGCDTFSQVYAGRPAHTEIWFTGTHGVEVLYRILGGGCKAVACVESERAYVVTGIWDDGRMGVWRGIRTAHPDSGKGGYGVTVFGTEDIGASGLLPQWICYEALTVALAEFFKTGRPPVSAEETRELYAFLEAAEESVRQGGRPIDVMETLRRADKAAQQDDLDEP